MCWYCTTFCVSCPIITEVADIRCLSITSASLQARCRRHRPTGPSDFRFGYCSKDCLDRYDFHKSTIPHNLSSYRKYWDDYAREQERTKGSDYAYLKFEVFDDRRLLWMLERFEEEMGRNPDDMMRY